MRETRSGGEVAECGYTIFDKVAAVKMTQSFSCNAQVKNHSLESIVYDAKEVSEVMS